MRIWVTRTEPWASETAERLRELGHDPVVAPVLRVRAVACEIDLSDIEALAFTSRNAVAAFAEIEPRRDLAVFVVGAATAKDALEAGFNEVASAEGDVEALAALILSHPPAGGVLHPTAREPAGELVGALIGGGVPARSVVVYETVETEVLPPVEIDAVLIHSPRAAKAVARLLTPERAGGVTVFAISEAAAAPLLHAIFSRVAVAPYPNESALLKLIVS